MADIIATSELHDRIEMEQAELLRRLDELNERVERTLRELMLRHANRDDKRTIAA